MDIYIRGKGREVIGVIDSYKSLIWTTRYARAGDFEIYTPATEKLMGMVRMAEYVTRLDDDMVGVVERIRIEAGQDDVPYLTISGRSAESILDRRIVWKQTILNGPVEMCLRLLVADNAISPDISSRAIPQLVLGALQGFTERMEMQLTGDNLLDAVSSICVTYGMGFKLTLNQYNEFVFQVVKGTDRSYSQSENPYVVFSPKFDNLAGSEYERDKSALKNVALVAGEGEGLDRKTGVAGEASGIGRREIYVDARDLSTNDGQITPEEYGNMILERGIEALSETIVTEAFSGTVEPTTTYGYKKDFFLGDIIQIENEYGMAAAPRIWEIIENDDETGHRITPTFTLTEV